MLHSGGQIGPYILVNRLGKGAFGVVWLAERRAQITTTKVALKFPADEDIKFEAIKKEADLWVRASGHRNVLSIIEADVYDGYGVIVSQYAEDGSLSDWLQNKRGKDPSLEAIVEIVAGILSGLQHLHSRGIIHRDVKPANILFQGDTPLLADFGISSNMKSVNLSEIIMGTPSYMAPEAFEGKRDEQTDIWSVGVILYQMLKNELPFSGNPVEVIQAAIKDNEPEPLPGIIPKELRRVVFKALSKNLGTRYKTAKEMLDQLNAFLANHKRSLFFVTIPDETPKVVEKETPKKDKGASKKKADEQDILKKLADERRADQRRESRRKFFRNAILGLVVLGALGLAGYALWFFLNPVTKTPNGARIPESSTKLVAGGNETAALLAFNNNVETSGSLRWSDVSPEIQCHFIFSDACADLLKGKKIKSAHHFSRCDNQAFIELNQNVYSISNLNSVRAESLSLPDGFKKKGNTSYEGTYLITAGKHIIFESVRGRQSVDQEGSGLPENTFSVWYEEDPATKEKLLSCELCKKDKVKSIGCEQAKYVIESIRQERSGK